MKGKKNKYLNNQKYIFCLHQCYVGTYGCLLVAKWNFVFNESVFAFN